MTGERFQPCGTRPLGADHISCKLRRGHDGEHQAWFSWGTWRWKAATRPRPVAVRVDPRPIFTPPPPPPEPVESKRAQRRRERDLRRLQERARRFAGV